MKKLIGALLTVLVCLSSSARDFSDIEITATKASGDVYLLKGSGGNIGVLATDKGLLLVDDQFAPLAEKIEQAMKSLSDQPLKYIVNTHYHGDHTGGNAHFAEQAPIFAHHNVRNRLADKEDATDDSLPVVTYEQGVTIHLGNEQVQLVHLPAGHTDGDTYVYFKKANALHTGDLFFELGFPYVDHKGGGTVVGYLANVRKMITDMPDDVVIIPGHGKLTNKARLIEFAEMIDYSIKRIKKAIADGKTDEQIHADGIGKDYQQWSWRFITEERWLNTLITEFRKS